MSILEALNAFLVRRNRIIKSISKNIARIGLPILSHMRGFSVDHEVTLGGYQMLLGRWEPGTVRLCKKVLRPGMTAVDIGGHVGYYTRLFSKRVGPSGKVFVFEPHPENFSLLRKNSMNLGNVTLVEAAVTSDDQPVTLYESSVGSGSHSLFSSRYPVRREIKVRGTTLDSYFRDSPIDFVKIDVEGAECEVLDGATRLLSSARAPSLIVEFSPGVLRARGLSPHALLTRLREFGFYLYAIDDERREVRPVRSWGSDEEFISSVRKYVNLFAIKK